MKAQKLDALLFPAASGAAIAAKPGYPTVIVPFGTPRTPDAALPRGIRSAAGTVRRQLHRHGLRRPRLIELAYAFEQATRRRVPPPSAP